MSMAWIPDADPREARLPQWVQALIRQTRRAAEERGNALAVARGEAKPGGVLLDPDGARVSLGDRPVVEFRPTSGDRFRVQHDDRRGCLEVVVAHGRDSGARVLMGGASNVVRIEA